MSKTVPKTARKLGRWTTAEQAIQGIDVQGKVAVVTGGSSGIGVETCRALAKAGARVYLCARSREAAESVVESIKRDGDCDVRVLLFDLTDLASVRRAAEELRAAEPAIHMLILNAGVMASPLIRTSDGLELQTGVNHVAHFYLTQLLLPALRDHGAPARIVSVSSTAHRFGGLDVDDLNWEARGAAGKYDPWRSYGQSKLCNVLFARELARRLSGSSVQVFSLHPGIIMSNLTRYQSAFFKASLRLLWPWFKTTQQGAATSIVAATGPEVDGLSGSYLSNCRIERSSAAGADMALAARLWEATERLLERALKGELRAEGQQGGNKAAGQGSHGHPGGARRRRGRRGRQRRRMRPREARPGGSARGLSRRAGGAGSAHVHPGKNPRGWSVQFLPPTAGSVRGPCGPRALYPPVSRVWSPR